jgi:hypothetical protein
VDEDAGYPVDPATAEDTNTARTRPQKPMQANFRLMVLSFQEFSWLHIG